jgi:AraC-like DNA-binding protein
MKPIPIFRAAHLTPYIDFLLEIGAPVERGLRRNKLPALLREQPDAYLPQLPTLSFLDEMSRNEGIEDLGAHALQGLRMKAFSEPFAAAASRSPTLKTALDKFRDLVHIEDNYLDFWITVTGTTARLRVVNSFPIEPQVLQYEEWNEIMVLIAIVRSFAGQKWIPKEIGFRANIALGRLATERFSSTHIVLGQDTAYITVPLRLLSQPPLDQAVPMHTNDKADFGQSNDAEPGQDFLGSLKRVLSPYLDDRYPEVMLAAHLAGTSVRTLQRRLEQCGTNYSKLIQQTRFEIAGEQLRHTDEKIIDIAFGLGYEDPAHFTRAFRQLAGISPREYRRQYLLQ